MGQVHEGAILKIVTVACDIYADIAPAYNYLLHKNWPDCPYDIVYVTNSVNLKIDAPVHYIKGKDIKYAWRLRQYIQQHCTDGDFLLLMMIDYLVSSVVDQCCVSRAIDLLQRPDIVHVRLRPFPAPQLLYEEIGFGEIRRPSRYALSLQPGIWKSETIYELLQDNESSHQTELIGSKRTGNVQGRFLCSDQPCIEHVNYYNKGKVLDSSIEWVKECVPSEHWPDAVRRY